MILSSLIWNIRGVGNSNSRRCLKELVLFNKVDVVAIAEPKLSIDKAGAVGRLLKLGGFACCSAPDPKLWVFWHESYNLEMVASSSQFVTLGLKIDNSFCTYFTFVYAANVASHRQILFSDLINFANTISVPWVIGGDFNCVACPSDRQGGGYACSVLYGGFQQLSAVGLFDRCWLHW